MLSRKVIAFNGFKSSNSTYVYDVNRRNEGLIFQTNNIYIKRKNKEKPALNDFAPFVKSNEMIQLDGRI